MFAHARQEHDPRHAEQDDERAERFTRDGALPARAWLDAQRLRLEPRHRRFAHAFLQRRFDFVHDARDTAD